MGAYATLHVQDFVLNSTKNDVDPAIMMLFVESNRILENVTPAHQMNLEVELSDEDEESDSFDVVLKYVIKLSAAKDRLEFMGFTLPRIREAFQHGIQVQLETINERRQNPNWMNHEALKIALQEDENVIEKMTFESWLDAFSQIVSMKLNHPSKEELVSLDPLLRYMLNSLHGDYFGYPRSDFREFLRAVVEILGPDGELVYDLTDLLASEYVSIDEDLCAYARRMLVEEFAVNHKIIVLTEGSTDKTILEGSLRLLYPHLADYYSFMDFEGTKAPGGASALVIMLKAFMGAGVVNRIIAFFDNDTAARSAMRALRNITISENVRILQYPSIEQAQHYPTLGPQGTFKMDVNGLAGSIELYLGVDVLTDEDGELIPIQWRGYDEAMGQYQGEILKKSQIQQRFESKIQECQADSSLIGRYDWRGIRAIFDLLRTAFHDATTWDILEK